MGTMMSEAQRAWMRLYGTFAGRLLMGLIFLASGIKLLLGGSAGVAAMIASKGFPLSGILAWVVIAVLVLGGAALMLGLRVECVSWMLIAFLLVATWFFHVTPKFDVNGTLSNLALIGGLLYVIAYGPGDGWKLSK